jgi:hypothetical protein
VTRTHKTTVVLDDLDYPVLADPLPVCVPSGTPVTVTWEDPATTEKVPLHAAVGRRLPSDPPSAVITKVVYDRNPKRSHVHREADGFTGQMFRQNDEQLGETGMVEVLVDTDHPADNEPKPTDGPDYHADHAAWRERIAAVVGGTTADDVMEVLLDHPADNEPTCRAAADDLCEYEDGDEWPWSRCPTHRHTSGPGILADEPPPVPLPPGVVRDGNGWTLRKGEPWPFAPGWEIDFNGAGWIRLASTEKTGRVAQFDTPVRPADTPEPIICICSAHQNHADCTTHCPGHAEATVPAEPARHTRTSTSGADAGGPDFCAECSKAANDWVPWPCPSVAPAEPTRPFWTEDDGVPVLAIPGESYRYVDLPDIASAALLDLIRANRPVPAEPTAEQVAEWLVERQHALPTLTTLRLVLAARQALTNTEDDQVTGVDLIAAERRRQVDVKDWTSEHDAEHTRGELIRAAKCYLNTSPQGWPWAIPWWKPSNDPVRNLVKAGALIAAELDRLAALPDTTKAPT